MERRRRTRALILGNPELLAQMAQEVAARHTWEILSPPRAGLVMIQLRESSQRSQFYLGEVLVTEALVALDGHIGRGLIQGDDPEAAKALALVDAAFNAGLELTAGWEPRLSQEESRLEEMDRWKRRDLAATRVNFETMETHS